MVTNLETKLVLPSIQALVGAATLLIAGWLLSDYSVRLGRDDAMAPRWTIVLGGAIPWVMQFLAVVLLASSVLGQQGRSSVRMAAALVATIGLSWWIGLLTRIRGDDVFDAAAQLVVDALVRSLSGESFAFVWTHRFCGPVLSIPDLAGPWAINGWTFLSTLVSLALVVSWLCFAAEGVRTSPNNRAALVRGILAATAVWLPGIVAGLVR